MLNLKPRGPKRIMTPQNKLIAGFYTNNWPILCLISVKPRLLRHHMHQIHVCRAYNLNEWIAILRAHFRNF